MDVWYLSYGSNLSVDRFLCYIEGGAPEGSTEAELGCFDKTPPKENVKMEIPYPLYFSKERSKWGEGGVAFIDHHPVEDEVTIGRKFLITDEQFKEVVAQENNEQGLDIDLDTVIQEGAAKITNGWYGRIMYLGEKDGAPIFTFTSNVPMTEQKIKEPAQAYIRTIANGLMKMGMTEREVSHYLKAKRGGVDPFKP